MSNFSIGSLGLFKRGGNRSRRWVILGIVLMVTMTTGFIVWPMSPAILDLRNPRSLGVISLMEHWRQGDVIVLVRHAERCDRSSNACLGPADGITRLGSTQSQQLGRSYAGWGLGNTDIMHSPITRTAQTAQFMFDAPSVSQQWLADCGKTMRDDVLSHKQARRNLILVTHSGCISDFEKQTGFKHAAASEYDSSLFVWVTPQGKINVLGIANMPDWPTTPSVSLNR
jgi:phosphohistidine phosphatase SixA